MLSASLREKAASETPSLAYIKCEFGRQIDALLTFLAFGLFGSLVEVDW